MKIHLCCLDGLVPKPERDDQAINAAVEQFHGSAMSKYVWSDPFASHGGAMVLCHGSMLRDKVLDRVTAERPTLPLAPAWTKKLPGQLTPVAAAEGLVFIASTDRTVRALDAATGQARWSQPFEADGALPSTPVLAGGRLYVGGLDNRLYALDAATGEVDWSFEAGNWIWCEPLVV
ncbi:hypothetical protein LCGC14_3155870, partial [marine sediment metagenome]